MTEPAPAPAPAPEAEGAGTRFALALAVITALGGAGRLLYLVRSGVDRASTFNQGDAFWYSTVAGAVAHGKGFTNVFTGVPTADHPPLTVVALVPASWLFDTSTFAQRLTMVVLGTAVIAVVGLAGRRLGGDRVGLIAAALAALLPALWVNDVLIMSETPTALAVAGIFFLALGLGDRPSMRAVAVVGGACGLAALARAETGLFLPLLVWPLLWRGDGERSVRLRSIAVATVATGAVLAPWFAYNLTRFDEPVSISTNDGLTLLGANCDATYHGRLTGGWLLQPCVQEFWDTVDDRKPAGPAAFPEGTTCADRYQLRPPCWDASTTSKLMRADGLAYLRGHLGDLPKVLWARNGRVWGWYRLDQGIGIGGFEGRPRWAGQLGYWATWLLLPVAAAGAVVLRRRRATLLPYAAALAIVVVISSAFYGLVRFRIPWDVASCLLAAVAVDAAIGRITPRSAPPDHDGPPAGLATPTG